MCAGRAVRFQCCSPLVVDGFCRSIRVGHASLDAGCDASPRHAKIFMRRTSRPDLSQAGRLGRVGCDYGLASRPRPIRRPALPRARAERMAGVAPSQGRSPAPPIAVLRRDPRTQAATGRTFWRRSPSGERTCRASLIMLRSPTRPRKAPTFSCLRVLVTAGQSTTSISRFAAMTSWLMKVSPPPARQAGHGLDLVADEPRRDDPLPRHEVQPHPAVDAQAVAAQADADVGAAAGDRARPAGRSPRGPSPARSASRNIRCSPAAAAMPRLIA